MAEKQKNGYLKELTKGLLKENPVLRLVLGTCPTLATSTSVVNGIGMGIAATIVLICSNTVISALRRVIPEKARIPAYIVIIASFVTVVQMLVKAFVPALDQSLGVFLPLIVVNCIILGRAEAFAGKNPVLLSAIDGLGMGIGFTAALFCMGAVREIIGAGTFLSGIDTMLGAYIDLGTFTGFDFVDELESYGLAPMTLFILPAGGFFVFGMLMALANKLAEKKGLESATLRSCSGCPHASFCKKFNEDGECTAEATQVKADEEKASGKTEQAPPASQTEEADTKAEAAEAETQSEEVETEARSEEVETEAQSEEVETEARSEEVETEAQSEEVETEAQSEAAETESVSEDIEPKTESESEEVRPVVTVKDIIADAATKQAKAEADSIESKPLGRKKKKKNKKKKEKPQLTADFTEPLPEVIPDCIKRDIEKNKRQEDKKE